MQMLEYSKLVLQKVRFSKFLFEKELRKAKSIITNAETKEFCTWCTSEFGDRYQDIIEKTIPIQVGVESIGADDNLRNRQTQI